MKKKILLLVLAFPIALHLFSLFFLHFDGEFSSKVFEHGFDKTYSTQVPELDFSNLDSILGQRFHFLGHGKQMMAFESEDGCYVLKLFNPMRPLKKNWHTKWKYWKRYSSIKWISREWFQKKARLKKLFVRHQMAYEFLREETGLIFAHLSPSKRICYFVHVTDHHGRIHVLALENTPFIIQEKAILVPRYLNNLVKTNRLEEANAAVIRLEKLLEKRISVGITDRIQTMENNYGFVGEKPIQIDIGRIRFNPELIKNPEEERLRILGNLNSWLTENYPHLR
ncbi:MAG: hypothetical protein K1000chlam2_01336 [Chlamydiae bacterium]|nr:hypothetical protein [Chlamydiota bacterium]